MFTWAVLMTKVTNIAVLTHLDSRIFYFCCLGVATRHPPFLSISSNLNMQWTVGSFWACGQIKFVFLPVAWQQGCILADQKEFLPCTKYGCPCFLSYFRIQMQVWWSFPKGFSRNCILLVGPPQGRTRKLELQLVWKLTLPKDPPSPWLVHWWWASQGPGAFIWLTLQLMPTEPWPSTNPCLATCDLPLADGIWQANEMTTTLLGLLGQHVTNCLITLGFSCWLEEMRCYVVTRLRHPGGEKSHMQQIGWECGRQFHKHNQIPPTATWA